MKKLFAVLVAFILVLSLGTSVFADEANVQTGTITISNAVDEATYHIYKMFAFAPAAGSTTQGRYTVAEGWADFLNGEGAEYLALNTELGTIVWVGEETDQRKAELAKKAVAYAKSHSEGENAITPAATQTANSDGAVVFENVPLGYYAIDTSLGTLCALTNVDNTFETHEKNAKPDITKQVQEDSESKNPDQGWGTVNDAQIGEKVNYKSTITVGLGATNYVMHDTMEAGLTFNDDVVVLLADGTPVKAEGNYTVKFPATDGHTFDVVFEDSFISTLTKGSTFTVYYSATLNANANIVVDGNDNTVYLSYGEDHTWETDERTTTTYTWKMDVLKHTGTGDDERPLAGAVFQLLDNTGTPITFTAVEGAAVPTYKVDANSTVSTITTDDNGKFEFVGLDEGLYYLHEVTPPAGYNKLAADIEVVISHNFDETNLTASYNINNAAPATIKVENKTGNLLPETGGIGTTIFYVVGAVMMIAAAVLLISKKRMDAIA